MSQTNSISKWKQSDCLTALVMSLASSTRWQASCRVLKKSDLRDSSATLLLRSSTYSCNSRNDSEWPRVEVNCVKVGTCGKGANIAGNSSGAQRSDAEGGARKPVCSSPSSMVSTVEMRGMCSLSSMAPPIAIRSPWLNGTISPGDTMPPLTRRCRITPSPLRMQTRTLSLFMTSHMKGSTPNPFTVTVQPGSLPMTTPSPARRK
mmetsp:Transcript_2935/g.6394  ORF Transcript_2935/g.6394 Transcript_2935/m.6394 type:complete len:205 (+) Transcript_2935:1924-2538(+)